MTPNILQPAIRCADPRVATYVQVLHNIWHVVRAVKVVSTAYLGRPMRLAGMNFQWDRLSRTGWNELNLSWERHGSFQGQRSTEPI